MLSLLAALAVSGPTKADDPVPARKVDVGGHKLTLVTQGSGSPTVVIEPGMGHAAVEGDEWKLDLVASREQVIAAGKLGSKPLAVLTHSPTWKMVPDMPEDVLKRIEQISQELQAELPKLSTNSSHKVAAKAGHGIMSRTRSW
jgi:hypothetical protein